MIFAAGLGSRLRPLTDTVPKALVPVAGVPMIERVARRVVAAGCDRLVVNVCPFADAIEDFVKKRDGFGVETVVVREWPHPLETGGGLLHARGAFRAHGPILLHNVDVLTDLDLTALVTAHRARRAFATLAVADRKTSRRLLFDDDGLFGRVDDAEGSRETVRVPKGAVLELGFAGVQVVEPALLHAIEERGAFSVVVPYLRLASRGRAILPHRVDGAAWLDIGRPSDLALAQDVAPPFEGGFSR
jgi:N-acetyl-alpha-D-muramate 1-phosphate uridylyltransferase